jgi:hypothetical protein
MTTLKSGRNHQQVRNLNGLGPPICACPFLGFEFVITRPDQASPMYASHSLLHESIF